MYSRQTLRNPSKRLMLYGIAFCLQISKLAQAAEPLAGPVVGSMLWKNINKQQNEGSFETTERFLNADIPVPIAAGIAMPFVTIRYRDAIFENSSDFRQDQRVGVGFLHHAAEGDPAWRAEFSRLGNWSKQPAFQSRIISNLIKPFPWLKLRPSDHVLSWFGFNHVIRPGAQPLVVPEFSWYREGSEGLILDLNAPRHIYVGLNTGQVALTLGLEQDWLHWQNASPKDLWILRRTTRANLAFTKIPQWLIQTGIIKDLRTGSDADNIGLEFSIRWNPTP